MCVRCACDTIEDARAAKPREPQFESQAPSHPVAHQPARVEAAPRVGRRSVQSPRPRPASSARRAGRRAMHRPTRRPRAAHTGGRRASRARSPARSSSAAAPCTTRRMTGPWPRRDSRRCAARGGRPDWLNGGSSRAAPPTSRSDVVVVSCANALSRSSNHCSGRSSSRIEWPSAMKIRSSRLAFDTGRDPRAASCSRCCQARSRARRTSGASPPSSAMSSATRANA